MRRVSLALVGLLLLALPAAAQSNVEVNAGIQFDFLHPGARSLAMGGAFIGLADDATAGFSNPAGLRLISRKEVSLEVRGRDLTFPFTSSGRQGGSATGIGIDTVSGLVDDEATATTSGVSFLSFVYPRTRWAVAAYRHEVANFNTTVQTRGPFLTLSNNTQVRRFPVIGTMDVAIVTYGVSASFNPIASFSVGAGVAFYDFSMDSRTDRYQINLAPFTSPLFYGAPNYSDGNRQNYQLQSGEDTDTGINLGALWTPSSKVQVGVVFRQGPDFDLAISNRSPTTNLPFEPRSIYDVNGIFHVPHVIGGGVAVRPSERLRLLADVTHVNYARMTEDFRDIVRGSNEPDRSAFYKMDDATELHFGAEYVFTGRVPIAARGGVWLDPEHSLVFDGDRDESTSLVFRSRNDDQVHVTFGGGAVFDRFEVNGGADIAERTKTVSVSAVVRF